MSRVGSYQLHGELGAAVVCSLASSQKQAEKEERTNISGADRLLIF